MAPLVREVEPLVEAGLDQLDRQPRGHWSLRRVNCEAAIVLLALVRALLQPSGDAGQPWRVSQLKRSLRQQTFLVEAVEPETPVHGGAGAATARTWFRVTTAENNGGDKLEYTAATIMWFQVLGWLLAVGAIDLAQLVMRRLAAHVPGAHMVAVLAGGCNPPITLDTSDRRVKFIVEGQQELILQASEKVATRDSPVA